MPRALITFVCAISLSTMTILAAVGPAVGRPADRHMLLIGAASPQMPTFAMTIL